jgi:hypothetical protein
MDAKLEYAYLTHIDEFGCVFYKKKDVQIEILSLKRAHWALLMKFNFSCTLDPIDEL